MLINISQSNEILHQAVQKGCLRMVQELIHQGVDVNKQNQQGKTPLHLAAQRDDVKMAYLLMKNGARVDIKDNKNQTPFQSAYNQGARGSALLIKYFYRVCYIPKTELLKRAWYFSRKNKKKSLCLCCFLNRVYQNINQR